MLELLLYVLILGVICYVISVLPIQTPFREIAYAIVVIFMLVLLFNTFGASAPRLN